MAEPAILALEDGSVFRGIAIGQHGTASGEVVFNTAMTGYQEILTDPSYARQIITLTHPHIGNAGCNADDYESAGVWASGLVIRDLPLTYSNFRADMSLPEFLRREGVVAIAEIDTRRLTRLIRAHGAQAGAIVAGDAAVRGTEAALAAARAFPGLKGLDLAQTVTSRESYRWRQGTWQLERGFRGVNESDYRVVVYDYGVKRNILRMLADRGCDVTVVPAQTPVATVLEQVPDGIVHSNGPGDPEPCEYAVANIQALLATDIPQFGICLGHQLLGLAGGARTVKMPHGHHGANHPVKRLRDGGVVITSQNHGFAVDGDTLPEGLEPTHVSLFDGSLQGVRFRERPALGFQGHPEASPGPHDAAPIFDEFLELMARRRGN